MCVCYRNWMSNDCSERVCQFGLAHVDTPKGDLDASSGRLTGPDQLVVQNNDMYPYGTSEQFPQVTDSDNNILQNTAHGYMECSNKGICDRSTGTCACFDGYDGSACQRASCPTTSSGVCSGHGTCETIKTIADWDNGNVYSLWDEYSSMGCVCDGGYAGADCSEKKCKFGADPLYYDDMTNIRYSNFTVQIYTVGESSVIVSGNYSIIFTDHYGEDWETGPIDNKANCKAVIAALEALPNAVIPPGTLRCLNIGLNYSDSPDYDGYVDSEVTANSGVSQSYYSTAEVNDQYNDMILHNRYIISFPGNVGRLPPIRINKYLDGTRPTMYTNELASTLGWHIYPNGYIGEDDDLVADQCDGILVSLTAAAGYHKLVVADGQDTKAVKRCLGDSDGYVGNNVEVYDWDYGTDENPHLIKLIDATQYQYTGSYEADSQADAQHPKTPLGLGNNNVFGNFNLGFTYTQLCHTSSIYESDMDLMGAFGYGWCKNTDPAGFFAVLKFNDGQFKIYTRAAKDFSATTKFWLYTTKGTLQIVNTETKVFNVASKMSQQEKVAGLHSNVLYVTNSSNQLSFNGVPFSGQIDCETIDPMADPKKRGIRIDKPVKYIRRGADYVQTQGVNSDATPSAYNYNYTIGVRTCLDKDDYVMVFNNLMSTDSLAANAIYPDIYKVKKIYTDENKSLKEEGDEEVDGKINTYKRHKIVLDYALNTQYVHDDVSPADLLGASMYRFTPAPEGPYNYVGACSNRGICDTTSGICQCFPGYTTDNCGAQNALAQ